MDASQPPLNDGTVTENDAEDDVENNVENNVESNVESNDESEVENNVEINQPTSAPSIDSPYDPAFEIRRHRIFDHRAEAQAATNALTACLAGSIPISSTSSCRWREMIRRAMAANGLSLENFEPLSKPLDLLLRYNKQITQTTQLELRVRKEDADAAATGLVGTA